jgi:hypothetical protein
MPSVSSLKEDSKRHVSYTVDNGEFHLERIDESNLIAREVPRRIHTKWIDTIGIPFRVLLSLCVSVTRAAKHVSW